jgi:DNA invertase Pin-like site-specific DNA recombinase
MENRAITQGMKVVCYARCSAKQQLRDGITLEAQEFTIRNFCKMKGFEIVDFIGEQISGSVPPFERSGFNKAFKYLEEKKAKAIVLQKIDRLGRSIRSVSALVEDYFQGTYGLYFVDMDIDVSTPEGYSMLCSQMTFSEFERKQISKRTKIALQYKKGQGFAYSRPKFGYRNLLLPGEKNRKIVEDIYEYPFLLWMKDLKEKEGYSFAGVAGMLMVEGCKNKSGNVKWDGPQVARTLYPEKYKKKPKKKV